MIKQKFITKIAVILILLGTATSGHADPPANSAIPATTAQEPETTAPDNDEGRIESVETEIGEVPDISEIPETMEAPEMPEVPEIPETE